MKKHQQLLAVIFAIALSSVVQSAAPPENQTPEELAKAKVNTEVLLKISPPHRPFSRVMPIQQHQLLFQPQILVENESRLPFTIQKITLKKEIAMPVVLSGYIVLGSQNIYLRDSEAGAFIPAAEHPLFNQKQKALFLPATRG